MIGKREFFWNEEMPNTLRQKSRLTLEMGEHSGRGELNEERNHTIIPQQQEAKKHN